MMGSSLAKVKWIHFHQLPTPIPQHIPLLVIKLKASQSWNEASDVGSPLWLIDGWNGCFGLLPS